MSTNSVISFAVVGMGHIGKRHAEMIERNYNSRLVAVCDILEPDKLEIDHLDVPYFKSLDDLIQSDLEIDVVNICTPNGLHAQQALQVLDAQKHVVIEKPMALTKGDAEKIIFKALHESKQVFAVMQNRYSPPSQWLKSIIDEKRLGKVYMVQLNCFWNRDDRYYKKGGWHGTSDLDGGTLFTQFSHFIDTLYWLFGDIYDITARFEDFSHQHSTDFEDSGIVQFKFNDGGMASINYSTSVWNQNLESSITIIGEKGSVKVAGQYMNEVESCNIQDYTMPKLAPVNPPNDYGSYKGSAANHHYVIENVVETLLGGSRITTNALEGLKVVEIIEKIYSYKIIR